jgi:hypothetical protein
MSRFQVIPIARGLIGGHYAVKDHTANRVIGQSFRLDREQADVLMYELRRLVPEEEASNDKA